MNFYYLICELIIDIISVILGTVLVIRKSDNLPKFYWGIIAVLIGGVFIWENVGWIIVRSQDPVYEYTTILNIDKMLKFYVLASLVSLYPLASLCPGYLDKFKLIAFLLVPIIVFTVSISFLCFDGHVTPLTSLAQIPVALGHTDVKLRLVLFSFTLLTPLLYFIGPLVGNHSRRKISSMMYLFIGFMLLLFVLYALFTLCINDWFFNGFGLVSILFSILFSIQYLRVESPLSDYASSLVKTHKKEENAESQSLPVPSPLFFLIDTHLRENCAYTDPRYTIEQLAQQLNEKDADISVAIKAGGYSGFREYINYLRLLHFREQLSKDSHRTVKELMYACGFTSRPTFYRIFSQAYHMTPSEYIEKHLRG